MTGKFPSNADVPWHRERGRQGALAAGDRSRGGKFDRTTATVGQLLDKWLAQPRRTKDRGPSTSTGARSRANPPGARRRAARQAGGDTLDACYRQWLAEGLSPATVHMYHAILSAACRQAVKWGWIDRAPTERATPPKVERKEMVVPTPEQLSALIKAAEDDDPVLATAIALAALTGARRGELVALRWSDVDLDGGKVRIERALTVAGGEQHIGPTKTHASRGRPRRRRAFVLRSAGLHAELSARADSPLVDDPFILCYNANGAVPANPDTLTHRFGWLCGTMEAPALASSGSESEGQRRDIAPLIVGRSGSTISGTFQ